MSVESFRRRLQEIENDKKLVLEGSPENQARFLPGIEHRERALARDINAELGGVQAIDRSTMESADDRRAVYYLQQLARPVRTFGQVLQDSDSAESERAVDNLRRRRSGQ